MELKKFYEFFQLLNEEVYLPVFDVVVDDNGVVYNGEDSKLVKGRVERAEKGRITRILGTDGKDYAIGIDKNGNLDAVEFDSEGRAVGLNKQPIKIPIEVQKKYKIKSDYYYRTLDYYSLIPKIATGWVNVKIDMEIVKRVRRYARSLGMGNRGHESFVEKLREFQRLSNLSERPEGDIKKLKRNAIQKEMAAILLLHHLNEIKDFFNPSSGGFLFESFIAGLIPDSRIKEDNSPVDIITSHGRYQCKLVDQKEGYVDVTKDLIAPIYLEWYLIARKFVDRIELLVIDGDQLAQKIEDGSVGDIITNAGRFSIKKIDSSVDGDFISKFKIDLTNIDGRIANLGESLKSYLDDLYEQLSEFQYNLETLITGVDQKGKLVRRQNEFDIYYNLATNNITNLKKRLDMLVEEINK